MSSTDPNNTPDLTAHGGYLDRLVRSSQRYVADQAREMGLKVGDVIVGRLGGGDPETGWWEEQRLTLRYLGEQCCVWKSEWSNKAITEFRNDGEDANLTLSCRDWYLVRTNSKAIEGRASAPCMVDALSEVLTQHALACVSMLNIHDKPWSFDVTDDGRPLITRESCRCSSGSMKYLRGLLPDGHPKGFSHNAHVDASPPLTPQDHVKQ